MATSNLICGWGWPFRPATPTSRANPTRSAHPISTTSADANFGAWGKVFPDPAMTLAAVDRLVHHATIFEINVDSYPRRAALDRKNKGAGRPQAYATIKDLEPVSRPDNQPST